MIGSVVGQQIDKADGAARPDAPIVLDVKHGRLLFRGDRIELGASHAIFLARLEELVEARQKNPKGGWVNITHGKRRHLREFLDGVRRHLDDELLETKPLLGVRLVEVPELGFVP